MNDLALIGFDVDSSRLRKGKGDLRDFGAEGARVDGVTKTAAAGMSRSFGLVSLAVTGALAAVLSIGQATRTISEFDASVSRVGAISRATAGDLADMRAIAIDLGTTTEFSATQAADGLSFLAMAGFNAVESIAAIPQVLDLATASGMGLARAADITSNVLSGFGINAQDTANVTDVLAAASSRANTTVEQLGSAMSTVAPIAAALEIDLADTAAAIGTLSDAGIQGERAGTALRSVLAALAAPTSQAADVLTQMGLTIQDVNPETRSLAEIMDTLATSGLSTADAMQIFGREAASGALVLIEGSKRLGEFGDELRNVDGAASDMANVMRDNLQGDLQGATSAVQGLIIAIGDAGLTSVLRGVVQAITSLVRLTTQLVGFFAETARSVTAYVENFTNATVATDNLTLAMGDEIAQANALFTLMSNGQTITQSAALAKLSEAEAHLRNADALRQETQAIVEQQLAALELQRITAQDALRSIAAPGTDLDDISARQREAFEEVEQSLARIIQSQAELNSLTRSGAEEFATAKAEVERIRDAIANAKDGMVSFEGATVSAVDLTERLDQVASGIDFSNAISSAEKLANTLNISVVAAASLQNLQASVDSGGGRGQDPRLFQDGGRLSANASSTAQSLERIQKEIDAAAAAAERSTGKVGGASRAVKGLSEEAREAARSAEELSKEIERLEFDANPVKEYNAEIAKLDELLAGGLSEGAYARAVDQLNESLAQSVPLVRDLSDAFGDFVARGFSDFESFATSILRSFQGLISQMVSAAARNQILIGLGVNASGGGGAAGAVGGAAQGLGGLGGLGGSGNILGSILSQGIFGTGGFFGSIGASVGTSIGSALGGAGLASSLGGIGAAVGAAIPVIGALGLAFSFFRTRTRQLDSGLQITIRNLDTLVQTFNTVERSRFFGLSRRVRTTLSAADAETTTFVQGAVSNVLALVSGSAEALGIASDTFDNFAYNLRISTQGLSEDQAREAFQDGLTRLANALADTIPGLDQFIAAGESSSDALSRLSTRLGAVNFAMESLMLTTQEVSLAGAAAASSFVDLFGSLENFTASTNFFYENFFSAEERLARSTQLLTDSLNALGIDTLPATIAGFRALVDEANSVGDTELLAALIQLSPAFAEIQRSAESLGDALLSSLNEDLFATGLDFRRARSRANNGIETTPEKSQAEMLVELRAMNARLDDMQSTAEITAANTGKTADSVEISASLAEQEAFT